ncbi:hypothetical protein FJ365_03290 [Candidatus Dependentiae bacterium]|nr:hypothetical protein [Candidatus Dependentiae bacterium]
MKNLVLALLLALGVSTVSTVSAAEANVAADVEALIEEADLDAQTKTGLIAWVKNNPVKTAAVVTTVAAVVTYGVFVAKNYTKFDEAAADTTGFAAAFKAPAVKTWAWTKEQAANAGENIKSGWNKSVEYAKEHKVIVAAGTVGTALVIAALIDCMNKDGYIRTALNNAKAEAANVEAVPAA